jgi:hypothetical protein
MGRILLTGLFAGGIVPVLVLVPALAAARYARSLVRTAVLQRGQAGAMGVVEGTRGADSDGCGKSAEFKFDSQLG